MADMSACIGTLKEAAVAPPAATLEAQQQRFNAFVSEYNAERSHEALGTANTSSNGTRPRPGVIPRKLPPVAYAATRRSTGLEGRAT